MLTSGPTLVSHPAKVTFGRIATPEEGEALKTRFTELGLDADKLDTKLIRVYNQDTWLNRLKANTIEIFKNLKELSELVSVIGRRDWAHPQPWGAMLINYGTNELAKAKLELAEEVRAQVESHYQKAGEVPPYVAANFLVSPTQVASVMARTKQFLPDEEVLNKLVSKTQDA